MCFTSDSQSWEGEHSWATINMIPRLAKVLRHFEPSWFSAADCRDCWRHCGRHGRRTGERAQGPVAPLLPTVQLGSHRGDAPDPRRQSRSTDTRISTVCSASTTPIGIPPHVLSNSSGAVRSAGSTPSRTAMPNGPCPTSIATGLRAARCNGFAWGSRTGTSIPRTLPMPPGTNPSASLRTVLWQIGSTGRSSTRSSPIS